MKHTNMVQQAGIESTAINLWYQILRVQHSYTIIFACTYVYIISSCSRLYPQLVA